MKKIVIIGCRGQLGQALMQILTPITSYDVIGLNSHQLDITDQNQVKKIISNISPYVIINCAAFTNVNECEEKENLAFAVNALGAGNLAIVAADLNIKLVHISTDYVFDGTRNIPYTEFDYTNPLNVYAKSKLQGEIFVEKFAPKHFIFRTSGLYGHGKNFVRAILEQCKDKKEIKVICNQIVTPTSALELSKCIISMFETENYGLFHATCKGQCSWAEFARVILHIAKLPNEIVEVECSEHNAAVKRPPYSVLDNYMLELTNSYNFPDWEIALAHYLRNEH